MTSDDKYIMLPPLEPDFSEYIGAEEDVSFDLHGIASMTYKDFQKFIDSEGKISQVQWFKNANLFYGLQDEIRNCILKMEA